MNLVTRGQILRNVRRFTDDVHTHARYSVAKTHGKPSCGPQCSYCCHQKIVGGAYQGLPLYVYLKAHGDWTPELRQHLVQTDRAQTARSHRRNLMDRIPCAFLREEVFGQGTCIVYPVRPSCCAQTFAVTAPPKCAEPDGAATLQVHNEAYTKAEIMIDKQLVAAWGRPSATRFVTLAAAVLLAEAAVEGLPDPPVHGIDYRPGVESWEREFDKAATLPELE